MNSELDNADLAVEAQEPEEVRPQEQENPQLQHQYAGAAEADQREVSGEASSDPVEQQQQQQQSQDNSYHLQHHRRNSKSPVQSKLFAPTSAQKHGQWIPKEKKEPEKKWDTSHVHSTSPTLASSDMAPLPPPPSNKKFEHINSRLYSPTRASIYSRIDSTSDLTDKTNAHSTSPHKGGGRIISPKKLNFQEGAGGGGSSNDHEAATPAAAALPLREGSTLMKPTSATNNSQWKKTTPEKSRGVIHNKSFVAGGPNSAKVFFCHSSIFFFFFTNFFDEFLFFFESDSNGFFAKVTQQNSQGCSLKTV